MRYAAIDFETANRARSSVCAMGIAIVDRGRVAWSSYELVRPPTYHFEFSYFHGIEWTDVCSAPSFVDVWAKAERRLRSVAFIAAHNAAFDKAVMEESCRFYGVSPVRKRFVCTMKLARDWWGIYPTTLKHVCEELGIPLIHHRADSDARACAMIVALALEEGWRPGWMGCT